MEGAVFYSISFLPFQEDFMNKTGTQKIQDKDMTAQLISADTFAKMLEISKRTLQRLQSKGELPMPIRLGGSVRWRLDIVKDWIENGCPAQDDFDQAKE